MPTNELYMQRCLQLASQAAGYTAPNPMVGAVLVHNDRIIGEGYHQQYGGPHAEVNCIANAEKVLSASHDAAQTAAIIAASTIYVSLEPCAHFGKTPPCADLIISKKIHKAVVGCRDPFVEVNGRGIEKLKQAGVEVITGVLEQECRVMNKRFYCFHQQQRPYIILKWAQTANGKIGSLTSGRLRISNELSNRLVHRWRGEEAAILVGTNTALKDDPSLTNRLSYGKNPVRLVLDNDLRLPSSLKIFNDAAAATIIFNKQKNTIQTADEIMTAKNNAVYYYQLPAAAETIQALLKAFTQLKIQSVLVEGGARLLQSFIDARCWDEARVICNTAMYAAEGVDAPVLQHAAQVDNMQLQNDHISIYQHTQNIR